MLIPFQDARLMQSRVHRVPSSGSSDSSCQFNDCASTSRQEDRSASCTWEKRVDKRKVISSIEDRQPVRVVHELASHCLDETDPVLQIFLRNFEQFGHRLDVCRKTGSDGNAKAKPEAGK